MRLDLMAALKNTRIKGWKKIKVEFSGGPLIIYVPPDCLEMTMKKAEVLKNPAREIERAIDEPLGGLSLDNIIKGKGKPAGELKAAITVSDITRPVPYKGKKGILLPLLEKLKAQGIRKQNVKIVVGTGTHRASTPQEKIEMMGEEIVSAYEIQDHDCEDKASLIFAGKTPTGTEVFLNKNFYEADLKIATGLTESHFMAGVSGGRKAVCPGLVDLRTIQKFHSPDFLESPRATNLILDGNPCHEEAAAVAKAVGVDFTITVTLDKDMRLTGVFAGDLEKVIAEAVRKIKTYVAIPVEKEFDIVLTHGGYVGRNHYQLAKAAVGAIPAVKPGGVIVIAADNRDEEPIGGPEYKTLIHLLKLQGVDGYVDLLRSPAWKFTKDQWEPEVWGRVLRKVGEEGLIYCTSDIPEKDFAMLPGVSGYEFLTPAGKKKARAQKVQEMLQNAVIYFHNQYAPRNITPRLAFISEGPYAVPVKTGDGP
ncbi:MAG: nickel-dependent lactate racemase [Thermodesulfobacteriota bacterium]|nr:nickel-dependent lactate racemase [Thermodesulfobacteriota bacterium]